MRQKNKMKIVTNNTPYVASPSKMARTQMRQELNRLRNTRDLSMQDEGCRVPVKIGDQTVYFSKGIAPDSPLFLQHTVQGTRRVHILSKDSETIAVFDGRGNDTWERRALLRSPGEILASLPKRAFVVDIPTVPATENQLDVIRRVLEIPAEETMPVISIRAAGRLIDRVTVEKAAVQLAEDLVRWEIETTVPVDEMTAA
jgi:hypothetical protein